MTMVEQPKPIDESLRALYEQQVAQWPIVTVRSLSPNPHWHVVQFITGSEASVADRLKVSKFGLYYPMIKEMRPVPRDRLSRKQRESGLNILKPKIVPFLPGYMFVHFDRFEDDWHDIFSFAGVRGLWLNGNVPKQVPDELINGWMAEEIDGAIPGITRVEKLLAFKVGETVRLTDTAFRGEEALIHMLPKEYEGQETQALDSSKRVTLFVGGLKLLLSMGQFEKL